MGHILSSEVESALEKMGLKMPEMPDMRTMMNGYDLKDGTLKAAVDYWTSDGEDIYPNTGVINLFAVTNDTIGQIPRRIETQLTLKIHPVNIAFYFHFTVHNVLASTYRHIIQSANGVEKVAFLATSMNNENIEIKKGDFIGYGYFAPIVPMNNISFTNLNAKPA